MYNPHIHPRGISIHIYERSVLLFQWGTEKNERIAFSVPKGDAGGPTLLKLSVINPFCTEKSEKIAFTVSMASLGGPRR